MRLGREEDELGNEVLTLAMLVVDVPIVTLPPSVNAESLDAKPLRTRILTSALTPVADAAANTPYVGCADVGVSLPSSTANIPSPIPPVAGITMSYWFSETSGSPVDVPRRISRLPAEIVRAAAFVLLNWMAATIRLSPKGNVVARESRRPIEAGTDTEEPSLNAEAGPEDSTSSRVSQLPAEMSVFVVASKYQQASCPELSVAVFTAPAPWVDEATLFDVHEVSVVWFESRSQKRSLPAVSRVCGGLGAPRLTSRRGFPRTAEGMLGLQTSRIGAAAVSNEVDRSHGERVVSDHPLVPRVPVRSSCPPRGAWASTKNRTPGTAERFSATENSTLH